MPSHCLHIARVGGRRDQPWRVCRLDPRALPVPRLEQFGASEAWGAGGILGDLATGGVEGGRFLGKAPLPGPGQRPGGEWW